jgi:hypothetical protein
MNYLRYSFLLPVLFLAACSSASTPVATKKKEEKPPTPVSGQSAVFYMFQSARMWSKDAEILFATNMNIDEVKSEPGKYGAWRADFVSDTRHQMKSYTYSVVETTIVHKGVYSTGEKAWARTPRQRKFPIQVLKTDSPDALIAATKEVKDYAAKHPDSPIQFELSWGETVDPAWRVIWGPSVAQSAASVFIDITNGKFLKKLH